MIGTHAGLIVPTRLAIKSDYSNQAYVHASLLSCAIIILLQYHIIVSLERIKVTAFFLSLDCLSPTQ